MSALVRSDLVSAQANALQLEGRHAGWRACPTPTGCRRGLLGLCRDARRGLDAAETHFDHVIAGVRAARLRSDHAGSSVRRSPPRRWRSARSSWRCVTGPTRSRAITITPCAGRASSTTRRPRSGSGAPVHRGFEMEDVERRPAAAVRICAGLWTITRSRRSMPTCGKRGCARARASGRGAGRTCACPAGGKTYQLWLPRSFLDVRPICCCRPAAPRRPRCP